MTSKFDEIRPYNNEDLPDVLEKLVNNKEFIQTLVAFRFARWPKITKPFIGFVIKRIVSKKIKTINSLREFQRLVEPYMHRMISKTTKGLNITGLETLDLSKPCLFVSNHRDIALDPAFVNWALHINGQDTVRIAVGDNLLSKDWVADVIRLNKCFVVQRSVEGRREKLAAAKLLSEYIHHSLTSEKQHIWIAQREGRAKDGVDVTNPAIVSMLAMNKPKGVDFADYIAELRIVPVSLSYEFDPCDVSKAKELCQKEQDGAYDKPDNEDMKSIVNGITGKKGRVNVHFGKLVGDQFASTKEVAAFLDKEILAGYQTYATSEIALQRLGETVSAKLNTAPAAELEKARVYLDSRLEMLNPQEQEKLLRMYANPLIRLSN
ncbi:1-acyl-sn-glycerol-3-phosphate acyltransferase [Glaciecola sp. MF2-115]|uniref:1-acyl-sn-glycerol-3-phosphate acyltransferase n=1 Tax=Glaciecola sp. MF2-115 TaxID=3384827 RepID=UPI0039A0BC08